MSCNHKVIQAFQWHMGLVIEVRRNDANAMREDFCCAISALLSVERLKKVFLIVVDSYSRVLKRLKGR